MVKKLLAALIVSVFALSACSDDAGTDPTGQAGQQSEATFEAISAMDGVEMVDYLDRMERDARPTDLVASVRTDEVLVTDTVTGDEAVVDLPSDQFYLSFAPYLTYTHDCFYHSLTTCTGELFNEEIDVTIVDTDGEILVDETMTMFDNGFVGVWLPADIEATLTVEYDGKTGTTEIGTGVDDPTCLTTLRLS